MHHRLPAFFFICAFLAVAAMRGQAPTAQMPLGIVLVTEVTGKVTMAVNGHTTTLKVYDGVPQVATINTGADSAAWLAFSNGVTMQLGADTELVLQEFLQQPFAATVRITELKEEPSSSRTILALNQGELGGNMKRLKSDQGSSFKVKTPVGVADGSCGTFRMAFRPAGAGQALFTLSAAGDGVGFTPPAGDGVASPGGAKRLEVRPGQEMKLAVAVNGRGQFVPDWPPTTTDAARPANENGTVAAPEDVRATTMQEPGKDSADAGRLALRPPIATTPIAKMWDLRRTPRPSNTGSTNIGPVAVDARWSNYGAYLQRMIDTVQIQWERIIIEQKANPVTGSSVTVKFVMNDKGRIVDIGVEKSTANETATRACANAITDRMPYGPWTDDMKAVLGERQEMTFRFYYQ